jgi:hypothetical protein
MMTGGMGTDVQCVRDSGVGPALGQQCGNLELPPGKPVPILQVCTAALGCAVSPVTPSLVPQLSSELAHFSQRLPELAQQQLAVSSEIRKRGKKIVHTIVGYSVDALGSYAIPLHSSLDTSGTLWLLQVRLARVPPHCLILTRSAR